MKPLVIQDISLQRDISGEMAALNRRRVLGIGHFIGRDLIERSGASRVSELLSGVPGVLLQSDARTTAIIQAFTTTNAGLHPRFAPRTDRRLHIISRTEVGPCAMQLFLDGRILRMNSMGVDLVPANEIAAIEVYRTLSEVPAEFSGDHARCGVVAIWTRRD